MIYTQLQRKIIATAEKYVGMTEIRGNLGWTSEAFEEKMLETGWKVGQAWCAYFTELVWSEVYDSIGALLVELYLNFLKLKDGRQELSLYQVQ
jgi:hypothetical protein